MQGRAPAKPGREQSAAENAFSMASQHRHSGRGGAGQVIAGQDVPADQHLPGKQPDRDKQTPLGGMFRWLRIIRCDV